MRLSTPSAIILATLLGTIVIVIGAKFIGQSIWNALAAVGTIAAVVWAVYHQGILTWFQRPKLEISLYELDPPHLRPVPTTISDKKVNSYILTLQLINTGKTIAKSAQPLITSVGSIKNAKWRTQNNWIPVPLRWVFDELSQHSKGKPTEERDLIPHRPYLFNLGQLSMAHPETFLLLYSIISKSQTESYERGEHCFELTAFAPS